MTNEEHYLRTVMSWCAWEKPVAKLTAIEGASRELAYTLMDQVMGELPRNPYLGLKIETDRNQRIGKLVEGQAREVRSL